MEYNLLVLLGLKDNLFLKLVSIIVKFLAMVIFSYIFFVYIINYFILKNTLIDFFIASFLCFLLACILTIYVFFAGPEIKATYELFNPFYQRIIPILSILFYFFILIISIIFWFYLTIFSSIPKGITFIIILFLLSFSFAYLFLFCFGILILKTPLVNYWHNASTDEDIKAFYFSLGFNPILILFSFILSGLLFIFLSPL